MIRHVVLFRWKKGVTSADVAAVSAALAGLPGAIPEIREYAHGPDLGVVEGNGDYAVTGLFDSEQDFLTYRNHPAHQSFLTEVLAPLLDQRVGVQFDVG